MRVGDKLLRGEKLSLPSGRASFVLEPRGQLYLYGLNGKIKSISTPKWPDADPKGEYAILNDRGELVHYYEHEREHEQISIAKFGKEATWKEPYTQESWRSHRSNSKRPGEKILELTVDGDVIIYDREIEVWNANKAVPDRG